MFHVEHMKNWLFPALIAIFALSILVSCTKADSEAYRNDPILKDYVTQQGLVNSQIESTNKLIETAKKDMASSVPQSGQFAIHRKKKNELEARILKLSQQKQFWKLKIESRAIEAQAEYLKAYKEKKEWPDKSKTESYFAEKRLRLAKIQWDQKDRIEEYKKSNQTKKSKAEPAKPLGN